MTLVLKVLLVSLVSKENLVLKEIRERLELRAGGVKVALQDVTGEMDKRVKLDASVLPAAKETQATEALMVILEMLVNMVRLALMEIWEIPVALGDLVQLAQLETLDQRVKGEVLGRLAFLDKREILGLLDNLGQEESKEEEEIMGQRALRARSELQVKRVKWDQRV